MSEKKDGGPAFPHTPNVTPDGYTIHSHAGMSLRDWFAGQAIASLLLNECMSLDTAAAMAYNIANQMIAEKEKFEHEPLPS